MDQREAGKVEGENVPMIGIRGVVRVGRPDLSTRAGEALVKGWRTG